MNPLGWNPSRELAEMSDRLNRVFARVPRGGNENEAMTVADWTSSVDISETTAEYVIKAEIPEVKKEDVKVTLEHGVLTIQGMRRQEAEEKGKKYHRGRAILWELRAELLAARFGGRRPGSSGF